MDAEPPRRTAHSVAVQADGVRSPVAVSRLTVLCVRLLRALKVPTAMLSVTLVNAKRMAVLNRKHLGHRGPTDVITFALGIDPNGVVVADIYVCLDVARRQAQENGVGVREEIARLVVHGTLHACGWDHPTDDARMTSPMWKRQEQLLQRFWRSTPSPA